MTARIEPALAVLRCPECRATLEEDHGLVRCTGGHEFAVIGGAAPDLAGDAVVQPDSLGQMAMRFEPLVDIYESIWRPLFTAVAGGTDPDRETAELLEWLEVDAAATLLDVACGPGNTTRRLAVGVADGSVVGLDLSIPMLEQAVADSDDGINVGFARVDAHRLPIDSSSVDGAHCAAALYLLADPGVVVAEIARVLRPAARFVGMTLVSPLPVVGPVGRFSRRVTSALSGLHYFGADELEEICCSAGLERFRGERRGASLLFAVERPG